MEKQVNIKKSRPIAHASFSKSPVSILVPFYGQYQKVARLVESILLGTKSNPYEICLIDDYSPNVEFIKELEDVPQVKIFRTPQRMGFGGALRFGFERTEQPWVVFLNSDCVVKDQNWLIEMGRSLLNLKDKNVRMVSAKTNNPGDGVSSKLKASSPNEKKDDFILNDGHLPLYCAMCHRELFSHIGGFIKPYPYGWYEDEELAYRMKHYGFRQAVCGKSWIYHEGGCTVNSLLESNPKVAKIMENNRNLCINDVKSL